MSTSPTSTIAGLLDSALEGSIVGSFTDLGYKARARLFDWDEPSADLSGQTAIVTGGTSGIGKATAAGLMALGADVLLTSRSQERAEDAADELNDSVTDNTDDCGIATGHSLDTGSFDSVRSFVNDRIAAGTAVDVLINNAGALTADYNTDDRDMELTLSTHLVGPYLLTTLLRDSDLLTTGARVLWMSSGGMYTQKLDVDHLEMSKRSYKGAIAYARAKRAQVEMVKYLAPQWAPGVIMHSVHPGWVDTAGVDAGLPGFGKVMGPLLRTAEQGADTMMWLAATGGGDTKPGRFWLDREPRRTVYLPGTSTDNLERKRLIEWLDLQTLPATVGS